MNTLSGLANDRADRVAFAAVDRLCVYFGYQPGDPFVHIAEEPPGDADGR